MRTKRTLARRRELKRRLLVENLECRRLLAATDLASISGRVYDDFSNDGYTPGEEIAGATLSLYRDNGDSSFQIASDSLIQTTASSSSGLYEFSRLTAGDYFVIQPAQSVGGTTLVEKISSLLTVSANAVEGQIVETIDNFDLTQQSVLDNTNDGVPVTNAVAAPEAIGGERDLFVNLTSSNGELSLSVDEPALPNLLLFDSRFTGDGVRKISWDGVDGDALNLNDSGLGGIDLTHSGQALGLQLQMGADLSGGNAVVRLYSDDGVASSATRYSTATLAIPQTGGTVPLQAEFLPFTQFSATSGGGVNLESVGAIELEIIGGPNYDGAAEIVGTAGQTVITQDFANHRSADLSLSQTVSNPSPTIGENVTFSVTISNAGPNTATNVSVLNQMPAGLTLLSSNPSLGSFNDATGLWNVGTLIPGDTPVLTLIARVDAFGALANVSEINTSNLFDPDSTPGNQNANEDDQTSAEVRAPQIDLSITQTVDNSTPFIEETVQFSILLSNAGPSDATGVQVRDVLPTGLDYVSSSASLGTYNEASGVWNVGSLASQRSATLQLQAKPSVSGVFVNTVQVIDAGQPDIDSNPDNNDSSEDDQASVTLTTRRIDLSLDQTVDNASPNVGDTVTFDLVVANLGPDDATGVSVRDQLPNGLSFVSASPSSGAYDPTTGVWTIGDIPKDRSETLALRVSVTSMDPSINTAEIIASQPIDINSTPDNGDEQENDQASVTVTPAISDLSLTQTADKQFPNVGENVTFTIVLTNEGPDSASNVVVRDVLPAGLQFVGSTASPGTTYDASTGLWSVGSVASGVTPSLQIEASVETAGSKTNTAEILSVDQHDPDSQPGNSLASEDDQASIVITPPLSDLSLEKQIDNNRPKIGDPIQYTVTVSNDGPSDATGVTVLDALPAGVTLSSSTASAGSYDVNSGVWSLGSVSSGQSVVLTIDAIVTSAAAATNTAEILTADQYDPDSTPGNGLASEDDQVSVQFALASADLSVVKTVDQPEVNVGDQVNFQIEVTNAGPDPATGLVVQDSLPVGLEFVSAIPASGTFNSVSGLWDIGGLAVETSTTLSIVAKAIEPGVSINTAQVQQVDQLDPDSSPGNQVGSEDDQSSVSVTAAQIDLELNHLVNPANPNVGEQVTFSITVKNDGPSDATGVTVSDLLPSGLTFIEAIAGQGSYNAATGLWSVGSIGSGSTADLQVVAVVDEILSTQVIASVVSADQPDADSTPGNNIAAEDDQVAVALATPIADLSLTLVANNDRPNVGEQVVYTIDLRNDGPDAATDVQVQDFLPDGLLFISAIPSVGSYDSQSGIWEIPSVSASSNVSLQITALVQEPGRKFNGAELISVDQADPDSNPNNQLPSEDDQSRISIDPPVIDLSLEKSAAPLRPSVNGELQYTLLLRNDGPDMATGIVVLDRLPESTQFDSATESVGEFDPITGRWTISSLAAGASATLVIRTTVLVPGQPENFAEVIQVDQHDSDSVPGNDDLVSGNGNDEDDQAQVTVITASSDLELTKLVDDDRPGVGSNVVFTLQVSNAGPDDASDIVVRDSLPAGMTFVSSAASDGQFDPASGLWNIPSLAVGRQATLDLIATVDTFGERDNVAEITSSSQFDPDSTPGNQLEAEDDQGRVTLVPELVDLALTKQVDDPTPNVGDLIRYTLGLSNVGPSNATHVEVTDQVPSGLSIAGVEATQGVYDPETGIWSVGEVVIGNQPSLTITARVEAPDAVMNTAEITASHQPDFDSTPGNGEVAEDDYSEVMITPQQADLSLTKSVNIDAPNQNEEILYTLILQNAGPNDATNVLVRDLLPEGLHFVSSFATSGTYQPESGVWDLEGVESESSHSLQITARVDSKVPVINEAEVIAVDQYDPDSAPDNQIDAEDDTAEVLITPKLIDLSIGSEVDIDEPNIGEEFEMSFVVANDGPDAATGLELALQIPEGMTVISVTPSRGVFEDGRWSFETLAEGESVFIRVTATAQIRGPKTVGLEVVSHDQADQDSDPGNQETSEDDHNELVIRVPLYSKRLFLSERVTSEMESDRSWRRFG